MSIEKNIDNMIKAAIERGEFKDLAGRAKPPDLDAYFATPEDVRMGALTTSFMTLMSRFSLSTRKTMWFRESTAF